MIYLMASPTHPPIDLDVGIHAPGTEVPSCNAEKEKEKPTETETETEKLILSFKLLSTKAEIGSCQTARD